MDVFTEKLQMQLLDFDSSKRIAWKKARHPYGAHIELTPKCNFRCVHCYMCHSHTSEEMSYERIVEIINILYEKGILFLTFTGGEILTRKDFLDIYMYAKRKGFLIELFTNGMLLSDKIIEKLKQYPPLVVDISLYGANEETYKKVTGISNAYEKVINNCKKLIDADIRVTLKSPIINETYNEINALKAIANQLGVPISITFEICAAIDGDCSIQAHQVSEKKALIYEFSSCSFKIDEKKEIEHRSKKIFACNVAVSSFVIDFTGKMCPCMKFRHRGIELNRTNFDEIWSKFGKYRELERSPNSRCFNCEAVDECEICPAEMDFLYDNFEACPDTYRKRYMARSLFYHRHLSAESIFKLLQIHE